MQTHREKWNKLEDELSKRKVTKAHTEEQVCKFLPKTKMALPFSNPAVPVFHKPAFVRSKYCTDLNVDLSFVHCEHFPKTDLASGMFLAPVFV